MIHPLLRAGSWALAVGALVLSSGLIYQSQGKLATSREKLQKANQQLANLEEAQEAIEHMESRNQFATATKSDEEEDRFLNGLRKHAELAKATIVKYESSAARYDNGAPLLAGITRRSSAITVEGSYTALRTFLTTITASPRLYTFSDIRWSRLGDACRLSMQMGRYVSPPGTGDSKS